jgi:hypothetical protein
MPKFHVRDTFEIPDRSLFVMAGSIVDGDVRTGMFVRIPMFPTHGIQFEVHSIEFALRQGRDDICLCLQLGQNVTKILRDLKIADQTLEVVADPTG